MNRPVPIIILVSAERLRLIDWLMESLIGRLMGGLIDWLILLLFFSMWIRCRAITNSRIHAPRSPWWTPACSSPTRRPCPPAGRWSKCPTRRRSPTRTRTPSRPWACPLRSTTCGPLRTPPPTSSRSSSNNRPARANSRASSRTLRVWPTACFLCRTRGTWIRPCPRGSAEEVVPVARPRSTAVWEASIPHTAQPTTSNRTLRFVRSLFAASV